MENNNSTESQSLSSGNVATVTVTVEPQTFSAHDVALAFLKQYYNILKTTPHEARNFYKDQSVLSRPGPDGKMYTVTTVEEIDNEIMSSTVKKWKADKSSIHAQDSVMEAVILGVMGYFIDENDVQRHYTQTFFLAPQEGGGFYVHNDFLQLIEIEKTSETSPPVGVENPLPAQQPNDAAKDSSMETAQAANKAENSTSTKEDTDTTVDVPESSKGKNPLPTEANQKRQPSVWQSAPSIQDPKKVSYASILAKEASATQQSSNAAVKVSVKSENHTSTSSVVSKPSILAGKASPISNNVYSENIYDLKAIRVKDLPPKMTQESLLEVVKRFGSVKQKNIQIKEYTEDKYRYAFVEFEHPRSARNAVEARFIRFEDRTMEIQYKKINNQGGQNYTGRAQRGGFKNDNSWGREGGEGRSSNSWGNRYNDNQNFGQHSGQGRDYNNRRNGYHQDR